MASALKPQTQSGRKTDMDTTDETMTMKETARTENNPEQDNRTILTEDPVKEFQEYLLDIGVRI